MWFFASYGDWLNIFSQSCTKDTQDIRHVFKKFTDEERKNNILRLMDTIYTVCWCAFQTVAFRSHNKRPYSINNGIFREMLKAWAV